MADGPSSKRPTTEPEDAAAGHDPVMCQVAFCPVSMLLTATGTVRPEVVEHLLAAGRELFLAAQAVINARAEGLARHSPLEKIEIG
jgi:hypothetical protein